MHFAGQRRSRLWTVCRRPTKLYLEYDISWDYSYPVIPTNFINDTSSPVSGNLGPCGFTVQNVSWNISPFLRKDTSTDINLYSPTGIIVRTFATVDGPYKFKLVLDGEAGTADFYIDGVLQWSGVPTTLFPSGPAIPPIFVSVFQLGYFFSTGLNLPITTKFQNIKAGVTDGGTEFWNGDLTNLPNLISFTNEPNIHALGTNGFYVYPEFGHIDAFICNDC